MIYLNNERAPVSVIIPCFCCSTSITRALESVAAQTLLPYEVILVEDASSDSGDTLSLLKLFTEQYKNLFKLKIIALRENIGAGGARNRGWQVATQPYIAFLDADDAWHPQKLKYQLNWMIKNPQYALVGHAHTQCDIRCFTWPELKFNDQVFSISKIGAIFSNPFATPTVMLKREVPFRFKDGKRYAEDYLLWLQIILSDIPAAYINLSLTATFKKDYGENGLSADLWKMEKGELDTYSQIFLDKRIGKIKYILVKFFSLAKYFRRYMLSKIIPTNDIK